MKFAGITSAVVVVAGLAAFTLQDRAAGLPEAAQAERAGLATSPTPLSAGDAPLQGRSGEAEGLARQEDAGTGPDGARGAIAGGDDARPDDGREVRGVPGGDRRADGLGGDDGSSSGAVRPQAGGGDRSFTDGGRSGERDGEGDGDGDAEGGRDGGGDDDARDRNEGDRRSTDETRSRDRDDDGRDRWDRRRRRNRYGESMPSPDEWEAPEGPVRIALQAGHWRANEAPAELSGLKGNGTRWGGQHEWEINLAIARSAATMLEELGYEVDVLPAVVPPKYRAHLFIAIHADGSNDSRATGYRIAAPRRDYTGRAEGMVDLLEESYGKATGLRLIPDVTRRMRSYYAFNARRYEHALHPMTIGVIIETGFLTSASDRRIILEDPDRAARGIVEAVKLFPVTPPPTVAASPEGGAGPGREAATSGTAGNGAGFRDAGRE